MSSEKSIPSVGNSTLVGFPRRSLVRITEYPDEALSVDKTNEEN